MKPLRPGTHIRAAEMVSNALLDQGATNLQSKLGRHFASRGDTCFESDPEVQRYVRRSDGLPYHRESIGRARRAMARRGWIGSLRMMPQHKPPGALYRSTHGTTSKHICWRNLGLRNPLTKGERREQRKKANEAARAERPRRHAHIVIDPALAALVATVGTPARQLSPATSAPRPVDRQREHQRDLEERAAVERERLAAWARDNESRGPP